MIARLKNATFAQRIARGLAIGFCAMLCVGVMGAAAVRNADDVAATTSTIQAPTAAMALDESGSKQQVASAAKPSMNIFNPPKITIERAPTKAVKKQPESGSRVIWMEVTAYCACKHCCGPQARGVTASGKRVSYNKGRFVAADTKVLPFGTKLSIPGYHGGKPVEVIDRGGAIKGNKLDVYFSSHKVATKWGRRWIPVTVVQ